MSDWKWEAVKTYNKCYVVGLVKYSPILLAWYLGGLLLYLGLNAYIKKQ